MKTVVEVFDSISDFSRTINSRKINKQFCLYDGKPSSMLESENKEAFTKTKSYGDADDLLNHGYQEGYERLETISIKEQPNTGSSIRPRSFNDVVGFAPHVPNMLAGIPQSMINTKRQAVKNKVLSLLLNLSVASIVSASTIENTNAAIMSAITSLERAGYRVNLYVSLLSTDRTYTVGPIIRIKDSGQYMDKLKMAYPLIHPSFLRRHFFRYVETAPLGRASSAMIHNYGYVVNDKYKIRTLLDERHLKIDKILTFKEVEDRSAEEIAQKILTTDKTF